MASCLIRPGRLGVMGCEAGWLHGRITELGRGDVAVTFDVMIRLLTKLRSKNNKFSLLRVTSEGSLDLWLKVANNSSAVRSDSLIRLLT